MEEKIKFRRTLGIKGTGTGLGMPPEILEYLEAKQGDILTIMPEKGRHG